MIMIKVLLHLRKMKQINNKKESLATRFTMKRYCQVPLKTISKKHHVLIIIYSLKLAIQVK